MLSLLWTMWGFYYFKIQVVLHIEVCGILIVVCVNFRSKKNTVFEKLSQAEEGLSEDLNFLEPFLE